MGKKLNHQHLPLEIAHDILLDLPVKSLSRFRCVSKPWCSLISDPGFQDDYHRHSQQNPLLLIARSDQEHNILHLSTYNREGTLVNNFSIALPDPFPQDDYHLGYASCFTVVQSCQGLVCLSDYFMEHILVCSPSTGELIRLPETFCSSHCIGFGYIGKEFKVVRFFSFPYRGRGSRDNVCEIFTLGGSEWISAENRCAWHLEKYMSCAPFLHGKVHLLPNFYSYGGEDDFIVVFNIKKERYTKMRLPEYYYTLSEISSPSWCSSWHHIELKELRGSLCLTFFSNTSLELWFLKDYKRGAWMKEYTIDLASSSVGFHLAEPLLIMHNGSMLLTVVAEDESVSLYCYNPKDNTLTQWLKEKCSATLYAESFLTIGKNHHVE